MQVPFDAVCVGYREESPGRGETGDRGKVEGEMNKAEVLLYAQNELGFAVNNDWVTVVRLRHKAVLLPDMDIEGNPRDEAEWAILDMAGKIDTGEYGCVYYV